MQKAVRRRGGRPDLAEAARLSQAILAAAEEAFLRDGFSAARVGAIASAAGTSKQTIYARFGSKERLFVAVSDALLGERFIPRAGLASSLRDRLLEVAIQTLGAMLDPKMVRMYSIITAEAARFPELAQLADDDATFPGRARLRDVIAGAAANGEIRCADPGSAMLMLQDMILAAPLRAAALGLNSFTPSSTHRWAEMAVDLFLDGTRPREAPDL